MEKENAAQAAFFLQLKSSRPDAKARFCSVNGVCTFPHESNCVRKFWHKANPCTKTRLPQINIRRSSRGSRLFCKARRKPNFACATLL